MKFLFSFLLIICVKIVKCQPEEIPKKGFVLIINQSHFFLECDSLDQSMDSLLFDTTKEFVNLIPFGDVGIEDIDAHSMFFKRNLFVCGYFNMNNKMKYAKVNLIALVYTNEYDDRSKAGQNAFTIMMI